MVKYQPNNIIFRIASSNAIAKFKTLQAQSFTQLARKDLKFDASAREVVLLEYDRFSQWLLRIERICMASQEGEMPVTLRNAIQESCREEVKTIESILETHPEIFCQVLVNFVKLVHNYSMSQIRDRIDEINLQATDRVFDTVAQIISDYLQHILMCLHELNNNYLTKESLPFICIADFCVTATDPLLRFFPMRKRAEFFRDLGSGDTFILKNYSTSSADIFAEAKSYLEYYKIRIFREDHAEEVQALLNASVALARA